MNRTSKPRITSNSVLIAEYAGATELLHRHTFGQITRLVYVRAFDHGYVVAKQLQRQGVNNRRAFLQYSILVFLSSRYVVLPQQSASRRRSLFDGLKE